MVSRLRFVRAFLFTTLTVFVGFQLAACGDADEATSPAGFKRTVVLRSESELTPGCYDWPSTDLARPDATGYAMPFDAGDTAIEFTLADTDGEKHKLSRLLETRPVLVVFGAYT